MWTDPSLFVFECSQAGVAKNMWPNQVWVVNFPITALR